MGNKSPIYKARKTVEPILDILRNHIVLRRGKGKEYSLLAKYSALHEYVDIKILHI